MTQNKPKILCIVGPTSSGKTALALDLARKFDGEIINADARQIYRKLSVGTGKPVGQHSFIDGEDVYLVEKIPHHLMDFVEPDVVFTVAEWREQAVRTISGIVRRGHLPIIVGGTGLYVQSLVDAYDVPPVPPQPELRERMSRQTLDELVTELRQVDPASADVVDLKNPRRVQRALEVALTTGESFQKSRGPSEPLVDALMIGIKIDRETLNQRINESVERMFASGWIDEVRSLNTDGLALDAPALTSIGYRDIADYIRTTVRDQGECHSPLRRNLTDLTEKIKQSTRQYAKRQVTWFKRDGRIHWVADIAEAAKFVHDWRK